MSLIILIDGVDVEVEGLVLPESNEYRSAWEFVNGQVIVNPIKKLDILRERVKNSIKEALVIKITNGMLWRWSSGSDEYAINLEPEMRELLSNFDALLKEGEDDPHGGFLKSNGVEIRKQNGNDLPDNALAEICTFARLYVPKLSRISINLVDALDSMNVAQLLSYDVDAIDWTVTWVGHSDWTDNLCLYNPNH